ncbi:acidic amino acid decarboxylase GADL1 [Boleophthalmus pectinirostris]|uniref:acidic amino acid decarboxylase GADL1 n=1 Tax=Boleophthalmus pectinirostris TaxID=150288 RepID=UPI000A1C7260|nr:acidic amino acid decarboxylase GADL1 [Boleophthalmus pectinirostris]
MDKMTLIPTVNGQEIPNLVPSELRLDQPSVDMSSAERFLERCTALILEEAVKRATNRSEKVCEWVSPQQLQQLLDLDLGDTGESEEELLQRCRDVIKYSVKTVHPHFFNQLFCGLEPYSLAASFIIEALKPSIYTYEVAPVFTVMEKVVLKKIIEVIGWEDGDGIFNAGGSLSNMYAINLARFHYCPEIKELGMSASPRLVLFTSQNSHYSIVKSAAFLGIGTKNVYMVPCDERGKMIPGALEEMILKAKKEGAQPFMVNATAGSTVLGAFDPIEQIADICEKYDLWLHVDACWGGAVILSKKHKHLLQGIHRANSVAWNPHKMMMACLQCCAFVVRDQKHLLERCYSAKARYLFQQDKFYDVTFDTGDKSIQCGRKPDAFKLWLLWKALGSNRLEQRVERALAMAHYLTQQIKDRQEFQLFMEPEYTNVCFWYVPPSLRNVPVGPEFWNKLHKVAPVIKERMIKKGSLMVGYQPHGDKANFFRMVIISPQVTSEDMDFVLDEIHCLGQDL